MKKLLTAFVTAALLTVCLCVPAFAADDCQHVWEPVDGVWGKHRCSLCVRTFKSCEDCDGDLLCDECGVFNAIGVSGVCSHVTNAHPTAVVLFDGFHHFVTCRTCSTLYPVMDIWHTDSPCNDECYFRDTLGFAEVRFDDPNYLSFIGNCPSFAAFLGSGDTSGLGFTFDETDHYLVCSDCGIRASNVSLGEPSVPHLGDDCEMCTMLLANGLSQIVEQSPGFLPSITTLVTASIDWLTAFALCIISTPLFLIFVCCVFVGLGIALIKRSIHL